MIDATTLERLHNSRDFLAYLREARASRDSWIAQLADAPTDRVQQVAGRILMLDDLLVRSGYAEMEEKWKRIEN